MSLGLLGRKVGMMRIFTDDGDSVPVTVLDVSNNRVTQIKTVENDGYSAVQVAFGDRRASRVNKAAAGHFAKAGVTAARVLREFHLPADQASAMSAGSVIGLDLFQVGSRRHRTRPHHSNLDGGLRAPSGDGRRWPPAAPLRRR